MGSLGSTNNNDIVILASAFIQKYMETVSSFVIYQDSSQQLRISQGTRYVLIHVLTRHLLFHNGYCSYYE